MRTGIIEIIKATQSGMSTEQFSGIVAEWLDTAKDPRFGRLYTDLVYQPMLELLDYLASERVQEFSLFRETVQISFASLPNETYRIPPERVVGSTTVAEFRLGKAGPMLMKMPEVEVLSDGPGKPEAIERFIGRRPIFAFGNSDGDKEMLEWTAAGPGRALSRALASHRCRARMGLRSGLQRSGVWTRHWSWRGAKDWTIVDMAADWNIVFPFQRDTAEPDEYHRHRNRPDGGGLHDRRKSSSAQEGLDHRPDG